MKLKLTIDGQEKEFMSHGISAAASLDAFDLMAEIDNANEKELYGTAHREKMLDFVVHFFNDQFTATEFLNGCMDSFFSVVPAMMRTVIEGVNAKLQEFPNLRAPEAAAKK